jgi:signal transduction histidine kinase/DNA-binding response OmpR family regulator/ligand-binding sensor domain-containing protein
MKKILKRTPLLCILSFCVCAVFAQNKPYKHLGIADGLPQGMVPDVVQDNDGYMWFATKGGLAKYDGYSMRVFNHSNLDSFSLYLDYVKRVFPDKAGNIWILYENDSELGSNVVSCYSKKTDRFYHFRPTYNLKGDKYSKSLVRRITQAPDGNMWCSLRDAMIYFKVENIEKLEYANVPNSAVTYHYLTLSEDADVALSEPMIRNEREMYLTYRDELMVIDVNTKQVVQRKKLNPCNSFKNTEAYSWCFFDDNSFVISEFTSFLNFYRGEERFCTTLKSAPFSKVLNGGDGFWYLANEKDLWKIPIPSASTPLSEVLAKKELIFSMPNGYFISLYKDRSGLIWAGSDGYGIYTYNPAKMPFHTSNIGTSISEFFTLHDNIFANEVNETWQAFYPTLSTKPLTDVNKNIYSSFRLKNNSIGYLSHENYSKDKKITNENRDKKATTATFHIENPVTFSSAPVTTFPFIPSKAAEDPHTGLIWMVAKKTNNLRNADLYSYNRATQELKKHNIPSYFDANDLNFRVTTLLFDAADMLWIGSYNGLIAFDIKTSKSTLYQCSIKEKNPLSNSYILSLCDDPIQPGRGVWVGTKGGGMNYIDKNTGKVAFYDDKTFGLNNVCYGILADNKKRLWISTNRGLAQYDIQAKIFRFFNTANCLPNDEFNTAAFAKGTDGRLHFGGVNGLTSFLPDSIMPSAYMPRVVISNLKINNNNIYTQDKIGILAQGIEFTKKINLAYDQNTLTINFAALDFRNLGNCLYRYRLRGINDEWIDLGKLNFVSFTNMAAGAYTFEVQGTNSDNEWSTEIASLDIVVSPPFWRSWWAYLMYVALLAAAGYWYFKNRLQQVELQSKLLYEQKETAKLHELDELKTQFFSNISHELRTPLTLIIEPARNILSKVQTPELKNYAQIVVNNSQRILNLVNQLLDLSKLESQKMSVSLGNGDLMFTMQEIFESFLPLATQKSIILKKDFQNESHECSFDKDKVEKIVYNLLSNAVKFTPKGGQIIFNINTNDKNEATISIIDNGEGIAETQQKAIFDRFYQVDGSASRKNEGTGIGLALCKELAELMQGSISLQSELGKGSTFTLFLPLESFKTAEKTSNNLSVVASYTTLTAVAVETIVDEKSKKPILLIVEDNVELRHYFFTIFSKKYQVITAENGKLGLEQALSYIPDLIVTDLMMPEMDGFEMIECLRRDSRTSHIPITLLTAKTAVESRIAGYEKGADIYLAKPFNTEELETVLNTLLQNRRKTQFFYAKHLENGHIEGGMCLEKENKTVEKETQKATLPAITDAKDLEFLYKFKALIEKELDNENLDTDQIANEFYMSRFQLNRKLTALVNQSSADFVRNYRLNRAYEMLKTREYNVYEVAYAVGFGNSKHFSTKFKEKFGMTPREAGMME